MATYVGSVGGLKVFNVVVPGSTVVGANQVAVATYAGNSGTSYLSIQVWLTQGTVPSNYTIGSITLTFQAGTVLENA